MQINNLDEEYLTIVKDILDNEEFQKLKKCAHHGISRFDHSIKVSYKAYKFAKKYDFNYQDVAIGGLLHDFFITEKVKSKDKFILTFTHSKKALKNANEIFNITEKQKNIILCHMFPLGTNLPRHTESWIVSLFDKRVALIEFISKFQYKLRLSINLITIILLNFIK